MDLLKEFLRSKSLAQLMMCVALIVNFVSQFFLYYDDKGRGMLWDMTNTDTYTGIALWGQQIGTGWDFHPHAYVILVALAFVFFRDDVITSRRFGNWAWWLSFLAFLASTVPAAYVRAPGAMAGGIAVLIAMLALWLHVREAKAASAGS